MFLAFQDVKPLIVTIVPRPTDETTLFDVVVASFGVVGVSVVLAIVLGGVLAFVLVRKHRRHPPELDRLPSVVSPLVPGPDSPGSSQAR